MAISLSDRQSITAREQSESKHSIAMTMVDASSPENVALKARAGTTATVGLSKDLCVPLTIKIGYLQAVNPGKSSSMLHPSSEKYYNPTIFKKFSGISNNSELFVTLQVFDGPSNNPTTVPIQTRHQVFTNNKRIWNQYIKLPINYNQLTFDSYVRVIIWEIVDTEAVVFGYGYVSLFNRDDSTLRSGSQKLRIQYHDSNEVIYGSYSDLTFLEKKLIAYEKGEFNHVPWLDELVLPKVEEQRISERKKKQIYDIPGDCPFHLYIEFPNFDMPVIYSDITYKTSPLLLSVQQVNNNSSTSSHLASNVLKVTDINNTSTLINSIEIPMSKLTRANIMKVFDPDFQFININAGGVNNLAPSNNVTQTLDPVEMKYHKLERNINNNSLLDKELKPSPQIRDELMRILDKPSNIELSDAEKNLIWKFRYYFSKNNLTAIIRDGRTNESREHEQPAPPTATTTVKSSKNFLTKFLKSINWDNDYELGHVFNELIPTYWSVDKIQIGDALELLGSYFNPFTLSSDTSKSNAYSSSDISKPDESRPQKIFTHVLFLRKFAVDRLKLANADELLLYLLQLVQALKYEAMIFDNGLYTASQDRGKNVYNILKSPLASFLIEKSIGDETLGNYFYWYVKVENEDQLNNPNDKRLIIYSLVLNTYIESLKKNSEVKRLSNYKHLKRQIWFIKKLTTLVELLRSTFKKNEATVKKVQFLRDHLADSTNEFSKFPEPFPLPLDPSVIVCGCYAEESTVFKSSLAPLKITLKTILNYKEVHKGSKFTKKAYKYGKYPLMFKIGDDLRQDQLVIQIINLMDQLLKNENLDLRLTPYRILATSPIAGLIKFIPNETLDSVLSKTYPEDVSEIGVSNPNGILHYLRQHTHDPLPHDEEEEDIEATTIRDVVSTVSNSSIAAHVEEHAITLDLGVSSQIMDNYVKSCAGYCVITYLLGVGDRHLDNLLLSPNGKFWHADFGYILGRDPKPFPPLMKLPIQVIDGMGGLNHENFNIFRNYCFITYTTLRKNSNLILNLFLLMLDANIPDIKIDPQRAIEKVEEKFCLEMSEEEAILHFQNLINDSVNAFLPVVIDRLHSLAQYWRA